MDYSAILKTLNNASLFELYRLNQAIYQQLQDSKKINRIKRQLKVGQEITYFDTDENRLIEATILTIKRTRILVKNTHDGARWNVRVYSINIDNIDTDIDTMEKRKIDRNSLKVGDKVCFPDKKGIELFGDVTKLNAKTAGVLVGKTKWRVGYGWLSLIIDGELDNNKCNQHFLEGKVIGTKQNLINI